MLAASLRGLPPIVKAAAIQQAAAALIQSHGAEVRHRHCRSGTFLLCGRTFFWRLGDHMSHDPDSESYTFPEIQTGRALTLSGAPST